MIEPKDNSDANRRPFVEPEHRIPVGVAGATGTVGHRLVNMLENHPWFRLAEVGASERSAGKPLRDLWDARDGLALGPEACDLIVKPLSEPWTSKLVLSALPAAPARELEPSLADAGHTVVSNASAFRMDPTVPLLVPEINPGHLDLLDTQRDSRGTEQGGIITNPNCSVVGLVTALAPLHRAFEVERVVVTTFQSISGAGRPGPAAAELLDNVVPFIRGEEPKISSEPQKILGELEKVVAGDSISHHIVPADFEISATAVRVPVSHGHLLSVSVGLRQSATVDQVKELLRGFNGPTSVSTLPFLPEATIEVLEDEDRPQPRIDRDTGHGMTVTVGRLRPCPVLDLKFLVLSHNLVRGAAGAALLNAELCFAVGHLGVQHSEYHVP